MSTSPALKPFVAVATRIAAINAATEAPRCAEVTPPHASSLPLRKPDGDTKAHIPVHTMASALAAADEVASRDVEAPQREGTPSARLAPARPTPLHLRKKPTQSYDDVPFSPVTPAREDGAWMSSLSSGSCEEAEEVGSFVCEFDGVRVEEIDLGEDEKEDDREEGEIVVDLNGTSGSVSFKSVPTFERLKIRIKDESDRSNASPLPRARTQVGKRFVRRSIESNSSRPRSVSASGGGSRNGGGSRGGSSGGGISGVLRSGGAEVRRSMSTVRATTLRPAGPGGRSSIAVAQNRGRSQSVMGLDLAVRGGPGRHAMRAPLTVPKPFKFAGERFHKKALEEIEKKRLEHDTVETRRVFKSRAMPDFKALHAAAEKNKGTSRRRPPLAPKRQVGAK